MRQRRPARPALLATAVAVLGCASPRPGGDAPGPAEPGQRDRVIARHDLAPGQRRWSQRYRSVIAGFWSIDMGGLLLTAGGQLLVTGT